MENWDEDIAEIILNHFPNASRKVCEEMLKEIRNIAMKAFYYGEEQGKIR